jgi:tRNA wybutosine-synthesizing protein 4
VLFVDVDYRELMITKKTIISETAVLKDLVNPKVDSTSNFVIESEQYYGVGCDLRDLQSLDLAVRSLRDLDEALVLCVAEVSVTYMELEAANSLIAWATTLSEGKSGLFAR